MENKWIPTSKVLPQEGKYVLGRSNHGYWIPKEVKCAVVRLVKGISMEERKRTGNKTIRVGDQEGNNLVPYCWEEYGPGSFFGQDITHWCPIPEFTK